MTKLFCFPYAGGSSAVYRPWKQYAMGFDLISVELSGRGKRMHEPLYANLHDATDDLYEWISSQTADHTSYALFGHSLGGLLAYELAQTIRQHGGKQPEHVFISGRGAPNIKRNEDKKYHLMNEEEFKKEVIGLGGTPPEFFNYPELTNLFLPLLRNDFRLAETDLSDRVVNPFDYDITVFLGKEDHEITPQQVDAWKVHSKGTCTFHYFPGSHFFLHDEVQRITNIIGNVLSKHRTPNLKDQKITITL